MGQPRREAHVKRRQGLVLIGIACFIVGLTAALILFDPNDDVEDTRETRVIDGITCIYNVTDDIVEACVDP